MTKILKHILYVIAVPITIGSLSACKTPYTPAPITATSNYLVVEGLININDSTFINLSRTVNLSSKTATKAELKATVTIESNQGASYALKELGKGVYAAASFNLSAANQYRLRIKTATGNTYTSDFAPTMVSPPIDSITWKPTPTTLQICANTHDPNNATRYYRWDYTEGWEFHSNYDSFWVSTGLTVRARVLPAEQVWDCFGSDTSHVINLGTSSQLSQDVISQQVINTIPASQEKIGIKYSIFVKQYALTKDAYAYWTLLKKNTEQLGSVFDAQPSASIGNIHNINNAAEVVIGYISAGTITTNRIFIAKSQLPNWATIPFYTNCELTNLIARFPAPPGQKDHAWQDQFFNWLAPEFGGPTALLIPIDGFGQNSVVPDGWDGSMPVCVDCTLRGKSTPPAYWK